MKILTFKTEIKASVQQVWEVLWQPENYTKWASAFQEGSFYKGELKQGNEVLLLTPEDHGMFSKIDVYKDNEELTFLHLGEVINGEKGEVIYENAFESYDLKPTKTGTLLKIELNCHNDYVENMNRMFPEALDKIKTLAEQNT